MRGIIRLWLPVLSIAVVAMLLIILVQTGDPAQMPIIELFKEPIIALAAVILTLVGVYATSHLQAQAQREQEKRQARKLVAQEYRDYLKYLLTIGQHYELVEYNEELKTALAAKNHLIRISSDTILEMIQKMPPAWELSAIDDLKTKDAVDVAIEYAIKFVLAAQKCQTVDYDEIRNAYFNALHSLDQYESK